MGGYLAHEVMRQAPGRVRGLMLISTSARADSDKQRHGRERQREAVLDGRFDELLDAVIPLIADPANTADERLQSGWRTMAHEVGSQVFMARLAAAMTRLDSRPDLSAIPGATLTLVE